MICGFGNLVVFLFIRILVFHMGWELKSFLIGLICEEYFYWFGLWMVFLLIWILKSLMILFVGFDLRIKEVLILRLLRWHGKYWNWIVMYMIDCCYDVILGGYKVGSLLAGRNGGGCFMHCGMPRAEGECGCVPVSICGSALLCIDWLWFLLVALSYVYWSVCG